MNALNSIQVFAVLALPVLFAITVHEAAHGWVANRLGDITAKRLGRVTLNPLPHIDPVGTLLVPFLVFVVSATVGGAAFIFGWAKPVPVDGRNLKNHRRDIALVALAGPAANFLMAILWGLVVKLAVAISAVSPWLALPLIYMSAAGVLINSGLMALNLIPLLPLDGGRLLSALLPPAWSDRFARLEDFGLPLLLVLLVTGLLGAVLGPVIWFTVGLMPGAAVVKELIFAL